MRNADHVCVTVVKCLAVCNWMVVLVSLILHLQQSLQKSKYMHKHTQHTHAHTHTHYKITLWKSAQSEGTGAKGRVGVQGKRNRRNWLSLPNLDGAFLAKSLWSLSDYDRILFQQCFKFLPQLQRGCSGPKWTELYLVFCEIWKTVNRKGKVFLGTFQEKYILSSGLPKRPLYGYDWIFPQRGREEAGPQPKDPERVAHVAMGKEGMMGVSGLGRRKKGGREGRSPCQGGEMEEREETEVSGGTPGAHTALFAQQRREQRSAVSEQVKQSFVAQGLVPSGQGRTGCRVSLQWVMQANPQRSPLAELSRCSQNLVLAEWPS